MPRIERGAVPGGGGAPGTADFGGGVGGFALLAWRSGGTISALAPDVKPPPRCRQMGPRDVVTHR
jgi:hypothetical protein